MRHVLLLLLASPVFAQTVPWRDAPKLALDTRLSGTVVVEALVDSIGNVTAAGIARSNPAIDDAAIARVRAMHFEPLLSHGRAVASLRQVPVVFEAPPGNGPADTWAAERCAEAKFTIDVDVRPDSSGRFEARWNAKGSKSQELYVIVLMPDEAVLDTTQSWVPQQLANGVDAPAWPSWHRQGRELNKGTSGTFSFTLPNAPWWNLGRVAVLALFHDRFDNRSVVRQKAWRVDRDSVGTMLVGDPGAVPCAAGPWHQGF